jgi:hypothetical protein
VLTKLPDVAWSLAIAAPESHLRCLPLPQFKGKSPGARLKASVEGTKFLRFPFMPSDTSATTIYGNAALEAIAKRVIISGSV